MPVDVPLYPVNLLVAGRPVLVVGGGRVAAEKARGLLAAGAVVHVVASTVSPEVRALDVTWDERPYQPGEVAGYRLAVACTDDRKANQAVFDDGEAAGIWVNAADQPADCSFILPAIARNGPLAIAVSTGGASPALARRLRDRAGELLSDEVVELAADLSQRRAAVRAAGGSTEDVDWSAALDAVLPPIAPS